ncbi:hypothetical protein NOS3756_07620 [Nostoc sp. NIES-3756]|uniref:hypothetical protein n=1 Tax=Nostoc sp. NIES-3756 TaxID=1751286 RepID=UPI00071F09F3|nr:hypothetical protein [Nostoc sp. NIES-3756]BAT51832.1 hypothetical protein NOS3756_07620 [Nostoc sp. NIES-3756]
MKLSTFIHSVLFTTSIALISGIAGAQTPANQSINTAINSNNIPNHSTKVSYLQPFNTAFLAYEGGLKAEGIPSGSALISEYQTGNLSTLDIVKAAVRANKVSADVLTNQDYLSAVESQLTSFTQHASY